MTRRRFLIGTIGVLMAGFGRPETLPLRKAKFEEVGDSILMTLELPALLRQRDRDAIESIDSGFDTKLVYHIRVLEHGTNVEVARMRRVVKIRWDPWKKRYVVAVRDSGRGTAKRYFSKRDVAIEAAITLGRIRVARASELGRGEDGPYYYATVFAQRNPLEKGTAAGGKGRGPSRGGGRDVGWFSRLVEFLARERPTAEETLNVRTNPFYLVPR